MSRSVPIDRICFGLFAALVLSGTGTGCRAFSFDRDWRRATATARAALPNPSAAAPSPTDPAGRWEGKWHSNGTGHSGRLRAIVEPPARSDAPYVVRFDAIWGGVFRFGETVHLDAKPAPATATQPTDRFVFDDAHDAGWLGGGYYQFTGETTASRFTCTYRGKHDHGTFEMTRVSGPSE
jgi:hypothetical protein